jgi:hypothetical protein
MTAGVACRCFHFRRAFSAGRIDQMIDDGETALCPNCGVDAMVSSQADRLSNALIRQLHAGDFAMPSRKYTGGEWRNALAGEANGT